MRALVALLALGASVAAADPVVRKSDWFPVERSMLRGTLAGSVLRIVVPGDAAATAALNAIDYGKYVCDSDRPTCEMTLEMPPGAELEIAGTGELVPEQYAGFGDLYSDARAVVVENGEQDDLAEEGEPGTTGHRLAAGDWAGIRGRFEALMFRGDAPLVLAAEETTPDRPVLRLRAADDSAGVLRLTVYAGPVARDDLVAAAPELKAMLYAMLWEPLRQLSFGLQWMLDRWQDLVGRAWLAILLLSLSVKLLMAPLIAIAERWQADVNRTKSLLEPELAAIRREHKGEEAHNLTLAVYRRHGVSHFYTFKSLAGFLIQIPVFIAAFDMLGENFRLAGESFLWIDDLAAPDRFASLPVVLPFFGGHVNLLPLLMTLFTVLAARLQEDASLAESLRQGQRRRLYAMAGLFFVLLYTFPAAMVLYWTANNFWHLLRVGWSRMWKRAAA